MNKYQRALLIEAAHKLIAVSELLAKAVEPEECDAVPETDPGSALLERALRALEMTAGEDFQNDTKTMLRDYLGLSVPEPEPEFSIAVEKAFSELWATELRTDQIKPVLQRLYNRAKDEVFHTGNQWPPTEFPLSEAARTFGEYGMSVREVSQEKFNNLEKLGAKRADERTYREGVEDGRQMAEKEREYRSQCFGEPNRRTSVGRHMDALRRTVEGDGEGLGR